MYEYCKYETRSQNRTPSETTQRPGKMSFILLGQRVTRDYLTTKNRHTV